MGALPGAVETQLDAASALATSSTIVVSVDREWSFQWCVGMATAHHDREKCRWGDSAREFGGAPECQTQRRLRDSVAGADFALLASALDGIGCAHSLPRGRAHAHRRCLASDRT